MQSGLPADAASLRETGSVDRYTLVSAPAPFLLLCGGGEERVWGIGLTACGALAGMLARALECN